MATVLTPDEIKQKIEDWITSLGGHEITGAHLNAILSAIMDYVGVGFAFKDSAPAEAPSSDVPVVYIAGPGTYTGYEDNAVEVPQGSVCIFMYDGSDWSKSVLKIHDPVSVSQNELTIGGISTTIKDGYLQIDNQLRNKGVIATDFYLPAMIVSSGALILTSYRRMTDLIRVYTGDSFNIAITVNSGTMSVAAFDISGNFISAKSIDGSYSGTYTVEDGTAFLRFTANNIGDASVSLTDSMKSKIRNQSDSADNSDVVKLSAQSLTDAQKQQARTNIGLKGLTENVGFSEDMVKALGIEERLESNLSLFELTTSDLIPYYRTDGAAQYNTNRRKTIAIPCKQNDVFLVQVNCSTIHFAIACLDSSKNLVSASSVAGTADLQRIRFSVPSGVSFIIVCSNVAENEVIKLGSIQRQNTFDVPSLIENVGLLSRTVGGSIFANDLHRFYVSSPNGYYHYSSLRAMTELITVREGDVFKYSVRNSDTVYSIAAFDCNMNFLPTNSTVGNNSVQTGTYTVPSGVSYLSFCIQNGYEASSYAYKSGCVKDILDVHTTTISALENVLTNKNKGAKVFGFADFDSNSDWIISDNIKASTTTTGLEKRLMYSAQSFEDSFRLCFTFKAIGTSFGVAFGKWANTSGTMFVLRYEGGNSYIDSYIIISSSTQTLKDTTQLNSVDLSNGNISISLEKNTTISSLYKLTISDDKGDTESINYSCDTIGFGWGVPFFALLSGSSLEITNYNFGYKLRDELDLIVLGHSYVEGNSISANKNERFAALVANDLGAGHCMILGQGGQRAADLKNYVVKYAQWFANAKYAIIEIGTNDLQTEPTEQQQLTLIADCESIIDTLQSVNIIPIWILDSGRLDTYQNGVDYYQIYHNWIMTQPYFVDVRNCFRDGNNNDATKYLSDETHPTIAAHTLMYNCIKAQAGYLFDV